MEAKEAIGRLEKSQEFLEWRRTNAEAYLAHAFTMKEGDKYESWQVGYYNRQHGKITIFEMGGADGSRIEILPESEVFKREETEVKGLDISKVEVDMEQAMETASKLNTESYPQIKSSKQIIILQNLEQGQLWNLTFVSSSMDVLNIKIDAASGEVLSHNLNRLFEFRNFKDDGSLDLGDGEVEN